MMHCVTGIVWGGETLHKQILFKGKRSLELEVFMRICISPPSSWKFSISAHHIMHVLTNFFSSWRFLDIDYPSSYFCLSKFCSSLTRVRCYSVHEIFLLLTVVCRLICCPNSWGVLSHRSCGLGHMTCFGQWDSSKLDATSSLNVACALSLVLFPAHETLQLLCTQSWSWLLKG